MAGILIIGATSAMAEATARLYAARKDKLYLLARNADRLHVIAADLAVRGASSVDSGVLDVTDLEAHAGAVEAAFTALGGGIDVVLIAHGTLPDQKACERDFQIAAHELNTNGISTLSLLTLIANKLEKQGSATIAVITSVAGDRGRQSNYVYGAAKGMVSTFLQGLRNRLFRHGVRVLDIKPGFVDTPMTASFPKGPLWAQPDAIAGAIVKAIDGSRQVIYTPFFWRIIMFIIRNIPETIFKRLSL